MLGKLTDDQLRDHVFKHLTYRHPAVVQRPATGEDCALIDFGEDNLVITSDPITGTEADIGALAVNVNVNDLATVGCRPIGLLLTILAPPDTPLAAIDRIMASASREATKHRAEIIGGHTEYTAAVNKLVVSAVAVGRVASKQLSRADRLKAGQALVMTKTAGLEGTAIIAHQHRSELVDTYGEAFVDEALAMFEQTSVLREGLLASAHHVVKMHDVTEGGLLGALWEVCHSLNCGCRVDASRIPIAAVTQRIAEHFQIDPLRLISSGCMLMIVDNGRLDALFSDLKQADIAAQVIGEVTLATEGCLISTDEAVCVIAPPRGDSLYEVTP